MAGVNAAEERRQQRADVRNQAVVRVLALAAVLVLGYFWFETWQFEGHVTAVFDTVCHSIEGRTPPEVCFDAIADSQMRAYVTRDQFKDKINSVRARLGTFKGGSIQQMVHPSAKEPCIVALASLTFEKDDATAILWIIKESDAFKLRRIRFLSKLLR